MPKNKKWANPVIESKKKASSKSGAREQGGSVNTDRTIGLNKAKLPTIDPVTGKEVGRDEHGVGSPDSVESTPTADGALPEESRQESQTYIRTHIPPPEKPMKLGLGPAPHFFAEQDHQVFYHDVIIYCQGQDLSPWLEGQIAWTRSVGTTPSSIDFQLNNAANRFILTPENLVGKFRRTNNSSADDYDESAKKAIFDFKSQPDYNQLDPASGGLMWPLSNWGTIFHKMDPIRVWVRNPMQRLVDGHIADEWMPLFTGYITSFPKDEDFINGGSTIQIHAEDIRTIIKNMRVHENTVLYAAPGAEADSPGTSTEGSLLRYRQNLNKQFDGTFFRDLCVNSDGGNPWINLTLTDLVAALTFHNDAQALVNAARDKRALELHEKIAKIENLLNQTDKADTAEIKRLTTILEVARKEQSNYGSPSGVSFNKNMSSAAPATSEPESKWFGKQQTQTPANSLKFEDPSSKNMTMAAKPANVNQTSRLGRMQRGFFAGEGNISTLYPSNREDQVLFLQNWYSLLTFGSPKRGPDTRLTWDFDKLRYWTEAEVRKAGEQTRTVGAWAPDAQAVHMIEPGQGTAAYPVFQNVRIIDGAVNYAREFTNRLELFARACEIVDYRFWVTGTGDLVFEFPQYDFNPQDYGTWEPVLTYDSHVVSERLDEESGDIQTVFVATGSILGRVDINNDDVHKWAPNNDTVVLWSPPLAARLGIQSQSAKSYPRITVMSRLLELAYLEFQKILGTFTRYNMQTIYRPWILPNKPVFNKYRSKYALVEDVNHTLQVTAGMVAGATAPTSDLTLNYVRSIDTTGVPRYITGGASMPIYYGERQGAVLLQSMNKQVQALQEYFSEVESGARHLTSDSLRELRNSYSVFIPPGQDAYNVIKTKASETAAVTANATTAPNIIEQINKQSNALRKSMEELQQSLNSGQKIPKKILDKVNKTLTELAEQLKENNVNYSPIQTALGPDVGISGVRHDTYQDPNSRSSVSGRVVADPCTLDRFPFSCPLGTTRKELRYKNVTQAAGDFPRLIIGGYEPKEDFVGVDFLAEVGEPVYAIAEGTVTSIDTTDKFGTIVRVSHYSGHVSTYGPLDATVQLNESVQRNEIIGTVRTNKRQEDIGTPCMQFRIGMDPNYADVIGTLTSKRGVTYPLTQNDLVWMVRAVIGEEGEPTAKPDPTPGYIAVASTMIARLAFVNDSALGKTGGTKNWQTLAELLVGVPPSPLHSKGLPGYCQPVSLQWRSDPKSDPKLIDRRERIRNLNIGDYPTVTSTIRGLFTGQIPLDNGEGSIHFCHRTEAAERDFLHKNPNFYRDMQLERRLGVGNRFFTVKASLDYKTAGFPKITAFNPNGQGGGPIAFYDPASDPEGVRAGVPNRLLISTKEGLEGWKGNKVLLVGGTQILTDLGKTLKTVLLKDAASVDNYAFPNMQFLLDTSSSITTPNGVAQFKDLLHAHKPHVVFVCFGIPSTTFTQPFIQERMKIIADAVHGVGALLWWIGPPTYDAKLLPVLHKSRKLLEMAGKSFLGDSYISADPYVPIGFGEDGGDRTADGLFVTGAAVVRWVNGILRESHGKDVKDAQEVPTQVALSQKWQGAQPPESCPPERQVPGPPGKYPPKPTAVSAQSKAFAIGDSVLKSATEYLKNSPLKVEVDAVVGRNVGEALTQLTERKKAGPLGEMVVVHIGNNGNFRDSQFDQFMELLADVPKVLFVTNRVAQQWQDSNNANIKNGVKRHKRPTLIDWHAASESHPDWFFPDGVHLRPAGQKAYSQLLLDIMQRV